MLRCYTDGGLLSRNPSSIGGSFGVVILDGDEVTEYSGIIDASTLGYNGVITNNTSELYALCLGVLKVPEGEMANFYSDSENALGRVFKGWPMSGCTPWLMEMRLNAWNRLKTIEHTHTLLAGHPSRAHLAKGWNEAKKLPVSMYNVRADALCNEARYAWEAKKAVAFAASQERLQTQMTADFGR